MIKPTIGRVVWYWPGSRDPGPDAKGQPLAALVAHVHSDVLVNLFVVDANGNPYSKSSVRLVHAEDARPEAPGFCEFPLSPAKAAK